ncbi:MAG: GNAT family N-acetyltransferase [Prevotellaceae bacterium]|nr:GNAT family N-acetyltransferase [Prevotellaceae bacterium]
MMDITVRIIDKQEDLPPLRDEELFHSLDYFKVAAASPLTTPLMAVAFNEEGEAMAHLLAVIRIRHTWVPPLLFRQARIYGKGVYGEGADEEYVFGLMLHALTKELKRRFCMMIEISDICPKMFGYRMFRRCGYFAMKWQEVYNSLHSMVPKERLTEKADQKILKAAELGVSTTETTDPKEIRQFYKLLRGFYRLRLRRVLPPLEQIQQLQAEDHAHVFVTRFKGKIIGGCVCAYSGDDAFLWYLASTKKRYVMLHADYMTVWTAIVDSWQKGYRHIRFLDVGLPWRRNPFREFILGFGGKPVARYRWFRFNIPWINGFFRWWYRE